jgi:uncharacterized GH25 family protein
MRLLALFSLLLAPPALAHELWVEPEAFQVAGDGMLVADLVNGQEFEGVHLAYIPQRFVRFEVVNGDEIAPVMMRIGDSPALNIPTLGDGLNVVVYESTVSTVNYEELAKFLRFVTHKDLLGGPEAVTELHQERGLPEADFDEAYTRYSKSLIGVGEGEGSDAVVGLETELVALTNPYTDDLSAGFRVQLYYQGEVRADEQVEIFDRAPNGTVTISTVRTDAEGIAVVPVTAGHDYMLDAVVLREPSAELASETGAVWETLWANLTFGVPE